MGYCWTIGISKYCLKILVFDLTNAETLKNTIRWSKNITDRFCDKLPHIIIVGNKSDMVNLRAVSEQDIKEILQGLENDSIEYVECSTKENNQLDKMFDSLLKVLITDLYYEDHRNRHQTMRLLGEDSPCKSDCKC